MAKVAPTSIISHWNHMAQGLALSSNEFYSEIERLLKDHSVKDMKSDRVNLSEGGLLSAKREYLQVRRGDHVFHVCAAPFGSGFFVSWWLGAVESGILAWLSSKPVIGFLVQNLVKPLTYYKIDTALMFQSITHSAVAQALDSLLSAKGLRALSETERKPIMRDFFASMSSG